MSGCITGKGQDFLDIIDVLTSDMGLLNKFVNGTSTEDVQLGIPPEPATPTLRNFALQVVMAIKHFQDQMNQIGDPLRLDSYAFNIRRSIKLSQNYPIDTTFTLPATYYPKRDILFVSYDGTVMTPRRDMDQNPDERTYDEVGTDPNIQSNQIIVHFPMETGHIIDVWVVASNLAKEMATIATMAQISTTKAAEASVSAANAKTSETNAKTSETNAKNSADSLLKGFDARLIVSGVIDLDRIPVAAKERMVIVSTDADRFALTVPTVHNGWTVKVESNGHLYYVVDETKLNSEAGYEVYTAARASAVDWSGVENKPASFTPSKHASTHAVGGSDDLNAVSRAGSTMTGNLTPVTASTLSLGTSALPWQNIYGDNFNGLTESNRRAKIYIRERLTAATNFYLNPSGSDSNDGRTTTTPMLTFAAMFNRWYREYEFNMNAATLNLAAGSYQNQSPTLYVGRMDRVSGVTIQGVSAAARDTVNIRPSADGTARTGITVYGGMIGDGNIATVALRYFNIEMATNHIVAGYGGRINYRDIRFGEHTSVRGNYDLHAHNDSQIYTTGGSDGNLIKSVHESPLNPPIAVVYALANSYISFDYVEFNFPSSMTVTEFVRVHGGQSVVVGQSKLYFQTVTTRCLFTNSANIIGKRATIYEGGLLYPPSANINNLPGTTVATVDDYPGSAIISGAYNRFAKQGKADAARTADLAALANYTTPAYIVGMNDLKVWMNGALCISGTDSNVHQYKEIGDTGAQSTTIQFYDALVTGDVISCRVR